MIKGIIFDFDGLIIDTEGPIVQSWQELYREHGCESPLSYWLSVVGQAKGTHDPFQRLEDQAGRALDRAVLGPKRAAREAELIAQQPVRPGVLDYLDGALRLGLRLGLASSSSCEWVTGHLARLGLDGYFECVRGFDDVLAAKPDPGVYRAVLEELGLAPDEAIAIEDSLNGVLAAKRAGLFCVAVPNEVTRRQALEAADLQLISLKDMPLEALLGRLKS